MSLVTASLVAEWKAAPVAHVLMDWTDNEVRSLLDGDREAAEALAYDLHARAHSEPDSVEITLDRASLEAYFNGRKDSKP